jgi:hypothetical protein
VLAAIAGAAVVSSLAAGRALDRAVPTSTPKPNQVQPVHPNSYEALRIRLVAL